MSAVDYEQITRLYRNADNKAEQIRILAQLTASDEETIIEVLKDHGVFDPADVAANLRTCTKCGRKYISATLRGRAVCGICVHTGKQQKKKEGRKKNEDDKSDI